MKESLEKEFRKAAAEGNFNLVKNLRAKVDINCSGPSKNTALHFAAERGHGAITCYLLQEGANDALQNNKNQTAYDLAKSQNKHQTAKLLLCMKYGKEATALAHQIFYKEVDYNSENPRRDKLNEEIKKNKDNQYDQYVVKRNAVFLKAAKDYSEKHGGLTPEQIQKLYEEQAEPESYTEYLMDMKHFFNAIGESNHGFGYCGERTKIAYAFFTKKFLEQSIDLDAEQFVVFENDSENSHTFMLMNERVEIGNPKSWEKVVYNDVWKSYLGLVQNIPDNWVISRLKGDSMQDKLHVRDYKIERIPVKPPEVKGLLKIFAEDFYKEIWPQLQKDMIEAFDAFISSQQKLGVIPEAINDNSPSGTTLT